MRCSTPQCPPKAFVGLFSSLRNFRVLCWEWVKWLLRTGPRLLFDVRTAEVSAPGWVITMPSAHLRCLKVTWYVYHKQDIVQPACVYRCHLNCVKERTQEFYSLLTLRHQIHALHKVEIQFFIFFGVTLFLKIGHT